MLNEKNNNDTLLIRHGDKKSVNKAEEKLKNILQNKPQQKSKLEEDPFIDWDMVASFIVSAIFLSIVFLSLWVLIMSHFESSYIKTASQLKRKDHPDLVFKLIPGPVKRGEFSLKDAKKFFNMTDDEENKPK